MLLSVEHRFLFIANKKAASSSIEAALQNQCEVRVCKNSRLKHMSAGTARHLFEDFVQESQVSWKDLFKFAVVRDPTEWVTSWFNFRSREQLRSTGSKYYAGHVEFAEFVNEVCSARPVPYAQIGDQNGCLKDQGNIAVDLIVAFDKLSDTVSVLADRGCLPLSEFDIVINRSKLERHRAIETPNVLRERIEDRFAEDLAIYRSAVTNGSLA